MKQKEILPIALVSLGFWVMGIVFGLLVAYHLGPGAAVSLNCGGACYHEDTIERMKMIEPELHRCANLYEGSGAGWACVEWLIEISRHAD